MTSATLGTRCSAVKCERRTCDSSLKSPIAASRLCFRVPRESGQTVSFSDAVYGEQLKAGADIEDFALLRSDGMPTYHLASCADDADLREREREFRRPQWQEDVDDVGESVVDEVRGGDGDEHGGRASLHGPIIARSRTRLQVEYGAGGGP